MKHSEMEHVYDKVCVRDLVLPMRIGIWSEEHGIDQRVRFTVELWVSPGGHRPGDLSSVISYGFITGGIKDIVAEGHVLLTETLAERIAAHCLSHPRAAKVRIVVEKIDRIPGASLGCEIVRLANSGQA
jgi:7,8-dihydroneopterin aldolase/epimerase/oxygenase